jgi:hypothetical protein
MSTVTITQDDEMGTVTLTQDDWMKVAGHWRLFADPMPPGIDRKKLIEAKDELNEVGLKYLSKKSFDILDQAVLKLAITFQSEHNQQSKSADPKTKQVQEAPEAEQPTPEPQGATGGVIYGVLDQNVSGGQLATLEVKPEVREETPAKAPAKEEKKPESRRERLRRERHETLKGYDESIYKLGPNEYYYQDVWESEDFKRFSKRELREAIGFPYYIPQRDFPSEDGLGLEVDRFFEELFNRVKTVDVADPLAGYIAGYREYNGIKILVTKGSYTYVHLELEEGDCSGLRGILERMWGPMDQDQIHYVYTWLRRVIQAMRSRTPIPIQFFALGGPPNSGKTWFQEVILDCILGGHESPSQFMDGNTPFNSKLFRVPHLMLSDQDGSPSIQKRRKFGGYVKRITSNKGLECHGKYDDEITLDPIRVPTCSFNTSPAERIKILPPLDDDIRDKMIITKVSPGKMPLPTATAEQELEFKKWSQDQIPALAWWLLNKYEPPVGIVLDSRFGIKGFCHPDIEKHLFEMSPERRLRDFIDDILFADGKQAWKGSSSDLEKLLNRNEDARAFLRRQTGKFSDMLVALERAEPDRFKRKKNNGQRFWVIEPPGTSSSED